MIFFSHHPEIAWAVVAAVTIDVMHNICVQQRSPDGRFGHNAMLKHIALGIGSGVRGKEQCPVLASSPVSDAAKVVGVRCSANVLTAPCARARWGTKALGSFPGVRYVKAALPTAILGRWAETAHEITGSRAVLRCLLAPTEWMKRFTALIAHVGLFMSKRHVSIIAQLNKQYCEVAAKRLSQGALPLDFPGGVSPTPARVLGAREMR